MGGEPPSADRRALGRRHSYGHELRPVAVIHTAQPVEDGWIQPQEGDDATRNSRTVRYNDQRLVVAAGPSSLQNSITHARADDLGAFYLSEVTLPVCPVLRKGLGLLSRNLFVCFSLETPIGAFRESFVERRVLARVPSDIKDARNDPRSIDRAAQGRAHDTHAPVVVAAPVLGGKHAHLGTRFAQATHEYAGGTRRLGSPGLVQRLVDASLESPRQVEVRLPVTQ